MRKVNNIDNSRYQVRYDTLWHTFLGTIDWIYFSSPIARDSLDIYRRIVKKRF